MQLKARVTTTGFVLAILVGGAALSVLQAIPPDVYSFVLKGGMGDLGGVRGTGPGELWYPAGIASDQGLTVGAPRRIYVADTQNNRIQIFNADGFFYAGFGEEGEEDGQFLSPTGVAVDAQGWILVADNENHRIQLFKPEGPDAQNPTSFVWKKSFGTKGDYDAGPEGTDSNRANRPVAPFNQFYYPNRVAIRPGTLLGYDDQGNSLDDGNGRVAVLDQMNSRVVVLTASLEESFAFGEYGTDALGEFQYPYGVGMDAQRIYVADPDNHRIQIFNINWAAKTATAVAAFGSENASPGDLEKPHDVQSDGTRLFVNDTFRNRVLVLNPDPNPLSVTPRCKEEQASALAGRCSIQATDNSWYDARVVGGPGNGSGDHLDGRFGLAEALTIDPTGRLVVADTNFHRFQVFKPSRLAVSSVTLSPQAGQTVISGATVGVTVRIANSGQTSLSVTPTLVPSMSAENLVLTSPAPAQILPSPAVNFHDFHYSYTTGNTGSLYFTAGASAPAGAGAGTLQVTAPPLPTGTITVDPKPEAAMGIQVSLLSSVVGVGQPVTVKVTVSNPGGFALQNVTPTVTPNGTDPQGFVINPTNPAPLSSLAKGAPANTFTFTFTAAKLGQVTFNASASATYTDGTLTSPISATTSTGVTLTIAEDVDPPVTVLSVPAPNGQNGWYIKPMNVVNLTLRATDDVGLLSINYTLGGAGGGTFSVPAQGKSFETTVSITRVGRTDFTYWATDAVQHVETPRTIIPPILIDTVNPLINLGGISPPPNTLGWNNTFPTVRFVPQDGESGIAFVTGVDPVTSVNNGVYVDYDGTNIPIPGTARDVAGNESSMIVPVNVDTKPPTVTCTTTPASANSFGWFTAVGPVTVSCTGTDQPLLSGMASVTVDCPRPTGLSSVGVGVVTASCTLDAEGDHTVIVTAKDVAGNPTPTQVRVKIDRTPPTVTCPTDSAGSTWPPNHNKWVPWTTLVSVTNAGISGSAGFTLKIVSSNELPNARGSGNTSPDMRFWDIGTPDTVGEVRAERTGPGTGRIYSLTYEGKDGAGNTTTCVSTLAVPHDQGKK